MTQTIPPQIHAIPDEDSLSAVFYFSFAANQLPRELIGIHGISPAPGGSHYRHAGRVFGGEQGSPLALVIRAGPGTRIEISVSETTSEPAFPICLEVGPEFEIKAASAGRKPPGCPSIAMNFRSTPDQRFTSLSLPDEHLRATFADVTLPTWLREILDSQLQYWKKHHAETYYQFTPWPVMGEEFARCVRAAPYWALARWKRQLFPSQISYCMERSPAGAVAFALERIGIGRRKSLISRFAGEALTHAADKLTEDEILECAERAPYAVMLQRRNFQPTVRARMLSRVVPMVRMSPESIPRGLEADILESMAKFPPAWLDQYQTFVAAMDKIAEHLSITPDSAALLNLHRKMDPAGRDAFFEFMAHRI